MGKVGVWSSRTKGGGCGVGLGINGEGWGVELEGLNGGGWLWCRTWTEWGRLECGALG